MTLEGKNIGRQKYVLKCWHLCFCLSIFLPSIIQAQHSALAGGGYLHSAECGDDEQWGGDDDQCEAGIGDGVGRF